MFYSAITNFKSIFFVWWSTIPQISRNWTTTSFSNQ